MWVRENYKGETVRWYSQEFIDEIESVALHDVKACDEETCGYPAECECVGRIILDLIEKEQE